MRRTLLTALAGLLAAVPSFGCRATPGFSWSMSITQPPTLQNSAPVSPIPAPGVAYAVEETAAWPTIHRQAITGVGPRLGVCAPSPDACLPPPVLPPGPAALPGDARQMPKGPAKGQQLQLGDCP